MILLRNAHIYDVRSRHHNTVKDVLVEKGRITKIAKKITPPSRAQVITSSQLCISPGWLDIGTYNGEPGYEYREDLESLINAAVSGGYAGLAPFPSCRPTLDNRGQLHYLRSQTQNQPVSIYPIASISKNNEGKELSEIIDLSHAGAKAFSDGDATHMSDGLLTRAMQYIKTCDALTIIPAYQNSQGHVHEGSVSVSMGVEGLPVYKELTAINETLEAVKYAEGQVLIYNISSAESIARIKKYNGKGSVTASVSCLNLIRDVEDVQDFNLNLKVNPPLRSSQDKRALAKAVESGAINIITSQHRPLSKEEKDQPFGMSSFGAATIETVFASLLTYADISVERLVHCLSVGPREALAVECPTIMVGEEACITVFDTSSKKTYDHFKTRGTNHPFSGSELTGEVIGLINGKYQGI